MSERRFAKLVCCICGGCHKYNAGIAIVNYCYVADLWLRYSNTIQYCEWAMRSQQ